MFLSFDCATDYELVRLVYPFPDELLPLAWNWLNEFPERNFDDFGPHNLAELIADVRARHESGETVWCVYKDQEPCGIIGYKPLTPHFGCFHGICFTRSAWGRQTTMRAVRLAIQEIFASGCEKIAAAYFADNEKIHRFMLDLGAVEEGFLRRQTVRKGKPVDMRLIAIFREENGE